MNQGPENDQARSANENRATPIIHHSPDGLSLSDPTLRTEYSERVNQLNDQVLYNDLDSTVKFDLDKIFLNKRWNPAKLNLDSKNAFIHGLNLAVCGPLFEDVQRFLRVHAMSKRTSLLKTQIAYLDDDLQFAPLNKVIFDTHHEQWLNISVSLSWQRYQD